MRRAGYPLLQPRLSPILWQVSQTPSAVPSSVPIPPGNQFLDHPRQPEKDQPARTGDAPTSSETIF